MPAGPDHTTDRVRVAVRARDDRRGRTSTRPTRSTFWDLTNRQDWHVCELQQRGTRSRSLGRRALLEPEPSVHAFDLMVVDRYAD